MGGVFPPRPPYTGGVFPPRRAGSSLLAPPTRAGSSLLAPPAPSGGAWGDASPQTPAIQTVRRMMERVLVSVVALLDTAGVTARCGAWDCEDCEDCGDCEEFPISKCRDSRDVRLAGVWGEASPQAPPEGAGGAREGSSMGAGEEAQVPPEGAEGAREDAIIARSTYNYSELSSEGRSVRGRPRRAVRRRQNR